MEQMTLSEVACAVHGRLEGDGEIIISQVSTDTRDIAVGSLFVPIVGERFDGHDFIEKALENGATAILSNRPLQTNKPVVYVDDTRQAYGALAAFYRNRFDLPVIGVTGSVGKTSTKEMIATVLSAKGGVHKTQGNLNNDIGLPATLLQLDKEHDLAVIELGMSGFGEIEALSKICRPTVGVITNIGVSHMENLGSREGILQAKLELLAGMKDDSPLIINLDNDLLCQYAKTATRPLWTFGIDTPAMATATNLQQEGASLSFTICYGGACHQAMLPTIGKHNVYNALAAFLVGIAVGMTPAEILPQYQFYQNAGMRQKLVQAGDIQVVLDCYNASPDSMESALQVIKELPCTGKRYAVFGDMLELGDTEKQMHREVGRKAGQSNLDTVFCYGPLSVELAKGVEEVGGTAMHTLQPDVLAQALSAVLKPADGIIFKASRGMRLEEIAKAVFGKALPL